LLIGTVSRLEPIKGLPVLLKAMENVPAYLIVAGDGAEWNALQAYIETHGLENRVKLL